eukprot:tig00000863_g4989.t1
MGIPLEIFDDPVPGDLKCPICGECLDDPIQVRCAQDHVFCAACITNWINSRPPGTATCPVCRVPISESRFVPSSFIKRLVGNLKTHCHHRDSGCTFSGTLSDNHPATCPFAPVTCVHSPETCGRILRRDLAKHIQEECQFCPCPNSAMRTGQPFGCEFRGRHTEVEAHVKGNCAVGQMRGIIALLHSRLLSVEGELKEVREEMHRRRREDSRLFTVLQVVREEDMRSHSGFDLVDFERIPVERYPKGCVVSDILSEEAKRSNPGGVTPQLRLWVFVLRQNGTRRPDYLLDEDGDSEHSCAGLAPGANGPAKLFLESSDKELPQIFEESILVFFKFYDPNTQKLVYAGHLIAQQDMSLSDLLPTLRGWQRLPSSTPLILFEEIHPGRVEDLDLNSTLKELELQHGDILCYQTIVQPSIAVAPRRPGSGKQKKDPNAPKRGCSSAFLISIYSNDGYTKAQDAAAGVAAAAAGAPLQPDRRQQQQQQ